MLKVENLTAGYGKKIIVEDINFSAKKNELISIIGTNGSGKTTLLKSILNLTNVFNGKVFYKQNDLRTLPNKERAKIIAYVPQSHNAPFPYTVYDVVMLGRTPYLKYAFISDKDKETTLNAIERVGITHLINKDYTNLSGGEMKLVLIARALAMKPKILILDEPTASLDFSNQQLVLSKIKELSNYGVICLMVTHDPLHAIKLADKTLVMKNGKLVKQGKTSEILTEKLLREIYGVEIYLKKCKVNSEEKYTLVY